MEIKSPHFNILSKKSRVLVVPLDWGLGHATRCIPLINELLAQGCEVLIAGEDGIRSLLQTEFPNLLFISLKGYRIKYSRNKYWLAFKIFWQLPGILFSVYREHKWLNKVVMKYSLDAVISDNRFGLYHSIIPSVYITHQLMIKTGNTLSENIAQKIHYWFIKKFNHCWIPDFEGTEAIAGELSQPVLLPLNVKYLGCFSRFEKKEVVAKKYDLLIIISGPEPQRTFIEEILLDQLGQYKGSALFIRGLPGNSEGIKQYGNTAIHIIDHIPAKELNEAIQQAHLVISRSGYTTLMDLIKLQQKAILIPTPGQTEQEYLARHLMQQKIFYCMEQQTFSLEKALNEVKNFPFYIPSFDMEQYKKAIRQFVKSL